MEFIFVESSPAIRFICARCGGAFIFKTKYLDIGESYPCLHCGTPREFTLGDAFAVKDLRNAWAARHPDPPHF